MSGKLKITILSFIILAAVYFFARPEAVFLGNINEAVAYIRQFSHLAPLISFILIILHAQVPYVPFLVLAAANSIIFGFWTGVLITWTAALTGSIINFYLARYLGHDWFARRLNPEALQKMKKLSNEKGFLTILIARFILIVPASLVNIAAGFSEIKPESFILATAIGKLPAVILYCYLGERILHIRYLSQYFIAVAVIFAVLYFLYSRKLTNILNNRLRRLK